MPIVSWRTFSPQSLAMSRPSQTTPEMRSTFKARTCAIPRSRRPTIAPARNRIRSPTPTPQNMTVTAVFIPLQASGTPNSFAPVRKTSPSPQTRILKNWRSPSPSFTETACIQSWSGPKIWLGRGWIQYTRHKANTKSLPYRRGNAQARAA